MTTEIIVIAALAVVLLFLLFTTLLKKESKEKGEPIIPIEGEITTECPICGQGLHRGERVHSVAYSQGEDRLMNIYGCPWCYSAHPAGAKTPERERRCPSCGIPLKEGSFAVARVFERPGKKMHVHVLGCPVCRNRR